MYDPMVGILIQITTTSHTTQLLYLYMYKCKLQSMTKDTSSQFKDALQFQRQMASRYANRKLGNEPIWRNTGDAAVEPSYMATGLNQTLGLS